MTNLSNTARPFTKPSHQPPLHHVSTKIFQTPQGNRGRSRRQANSQGCGTRGVSIGRVIDFLVNCYVFLTLYHNINNYFSFILLFYLFQFYISIT